MWMMGRRLKQTTWLQPRLQEFSLDLARIELCRPKNRLLRPCQTAMASSLWWRLPAL